MARRPERPQRQPCVFCFSGVPHEACRPPASPGKPEFRESKLPARNRRGYRRGKKYYGNGFTGVSPGGAIW